MTFTLTQNQRKWHSNVLRIIFLSNRRICWTKKNPENNFLFLFYFCRIVVNHFKMDRSLIMKDCHIVKHIIMQNVDHYVLVAQNQLLAVALRPCSGNSIQSILYAHFVWNNWIREHLKNKMINRIVILVSINYLVNAESEKLKRNKTET